LERHIAAKAIKVCSFTGDIRPLARANNPSRSGQTEFGEREREREIGWIRWVF
jgi:hypothetical protein